MPMPSVEPMPPDFREDFRSVPLDAHEASYFAASARISSFSSVVCIVANLFIAAGVARAAATMTCDLDP